MHFCQSWRHGHQPVLLPPSHFGMKSYGFPFHSVLYLMPTFKKHFISPAVLLEDVLWRKAVLESVVEPLPADKQLWIASVAPRLARELFLKCRPSSAHLP